jgi:hypothetical protein
VSSVDKEIMVGDIRVEIKVPNGDSDSDQYSMKYKNL